MSLQVYSHQKNEQSRLFYGNLIDGADQIGSTSPPDIRPWHVISSPSLIVVLPNPQTELSNNISLREMLSSVAGLQKEFENLVNKWHKERGVTSSITQMAMCNSYQRIIGMGKKAVPLILQQMKKEGDDPDHWFWALQAITGENPVSTEDQGDMKRMAKDWIEWGST